MYSLYFYNQLRSIYFNFRYLPFKQAVYLPIWITTNFKIGQLKRGQIILDQAYRKSVFFGDCGSSGFPEHSGGLWMKDGAKLILHGFTVLAQGTSIRCDQGATIELGKQFYSNKNCFIRSSGIVKFGNNCSLGWNVQLNTDDGHIIWHDGLKRERKGDINIGNHVWLTSNSVICKGVSIADGCIVAQGAVVTKKIEKKDSLIGGIPAKIVKHNIKWEQ